MRLKGEIVFPNNIRQLRLRKRLTQAQLGRQLDPPLGGSTISKMESGERRLTNLQLANLAALLGCPPEAIPVVGSRDPSPGVRQWQSVQEKAVRHTIESGAAAVGYVLAVLRKKSGATMQQVATAIGMTLSVYHRLEMASRSIQSNEVEAIARFYGFATTKLIGMLERRTLDNRTQLATGVAAEQLLPRAPRSLLKDDAKWGRLGALERCAMRRSIRVVAPPLETTMLPVYGKVANGDDGRASFVIDRSVMVDQISIAELVCPDPHSFIVRNFSRRLGFLLKPGALAYVDSRTPVAMGDIAFVSRHGGTAEAAIVIGEGLGPLKFKMYNPEEEIPIDDPLIAAVLRVRMLIFP